MVVELEHRANGAGGWRPAPARLQVLDEHGIRTATRTAERKECAKTEDAQECIAVGDYHYSGLPLAPFALAFESGAKILPLRLERTTPSRAALEKHLTTLFAATPSTTQMQPEIYSWTHIAGGDWVEQRTWREEYRPGWFRTAVTPTGLRLVDCSLSISGPLTEFACTRQPATVQFVQRVVYLNKRRIGGHDDAALGPSVRYAAMINGTLAYFFVVDWNSVSHVHVAFRLNDAWHEDTVASNRIAE